MKRCLSILAFGLLLLTSCLNELQGDREEASGASNIVLNIATKPQTKLGAASDGDVMSNLHIWLVYNNVVNRYLSQDDAACTISGSTATATFKNIPRGACTLYLVANLPVDSTLPTSFGVGSTITDDFLKYVLPEVVNCEPPFGDSTPGMPLSTSVSLSVGAGTNRVSAELVRTCAKLSITVRNNTTNNTIILKDLIFTNKNPNVGYLFEQSDYSIPDATSFGPFMSITHSSGETVSDVIPQGGERTYIQQYMYETATNGAADLGFKIVGGLFPDGTYKATVGEVSINTLSFENSFRTGSSFLIKSSNNDLYLYDNNGTLALQSLSSFNSIPKGYLWTISGNNSNSATIKGSSGYYLKLSSSGASLGSNTNLKVSSSSGSFQLSYTSKQKTYYLTINGSSLTTTTTSTESNTYWKIATVESKKVTNFQGATVIFDKTISSLNYINKYGIPVPLEQIRRNQDVKIVVNIHYNPNSGVLYFETSDWVDDDNETTFD